MLGLWVAVPVVWAQTSTVAGGQEATPSPEVVSVAAPATPPWEGLASDGFEVTDAGDPASASLLRYVFKRGQTQKISLSGDIANTIGTAGTADLTWSVEGRLRVQDVSAGVATVKVRLGAYNVSLSYTTRAKAEEKKAVESAIAEVDLTEMAAAKGGGTWRIDDRGRVLDPSGPDGVDDNHAKAWFDPAAFVVELPEQPVGVGAVWWVGGGRPGHVSATGRVPSATSYTLRARDGAGFQLGQSLVTPEGAGVPNVSGEAAGDATVVVHAPLPTRSSVTLRGRGSVGAPSEGLVFPLTQTGRITLEATTPESD